MESLATRLTLFFITHNLISAEQEEWCNYALVRRLEFTLSLVLFLIIGILISGIAETVLFCFGVFILRKRTNGYHAKTFAGCLIQSSCSEILALLIVPCIFPLMQIVLLIIASVIILFLAPVNNKNIHLNCDEMSALRKSTRVRLVFIIGATCFLSFSYPRLSAYLVMAIFYVAMLILLSRSGFGIQ